MLDPKEQAKGGFRAHAEREQARRDALAEVRRQADAGAGTTGDAPGTPDAAESQADGERSPYAPPEDGERSPYAPREGGERSPYAPPAGRQPKRWR